MTFETTLILPPALVGLVSCGGPALKIDRCDGWEAIWTEKACHDRLVGCQ